MRRQLICTLLGSAAALSAAPALAQSDEKPFDGAYAGVAIGYDFQGNDPGSKLLFDRNRDGVFGDPVPTTSGVDAFTPGYCDGFAQGTALLDTCENDRSRMSYYGRVGFDKQYGAIVIGAVAEFGKTRISDAVSAFSTTPASYTFVRAVNWESSARLRAGFAARNTLFYATGGIGYAEIKNSFRTSNTTNAFSDSGNDHDWGYVVGGGLEQKISPHFSIGIEYSFHDYKDGDYRVHVTRGTAAATNPFVLAPNTSGTDIKRIDDRFRWHSARAVLAYRF